MDLLEHQAKELFARYGVPVPRGRVATTPEHALLIATELGGPVVVKAQVKVGGRGKAGGVALADSPDDAAATADRILGMDIKGHLVRSVLVEQASDIEAEYYVSFLLDRAARGFLAMASAEGGVEIEVVATQRPGALARIPVDARGGVDEAKGRDIAAAAHLPDRALDAAGQVIARLWDCFVGADATLVEVNPLVLSGDAAVLALDGKVTIDGNALYRQPELAAYAEDDAEDPLEQAARAKGLNYVKLDGQVGVIGNGAGLVMSTLDVVAGAGAHYGGVTPANFLDIGGGASAQVMADGLSIVLADPSVRSVFVNIFGGITQGDAVANGIVQGVRLLGQLNKPVVVRLDGNNAELGRRILDDAAIPGLRSVDTMDGAARLAAELAATG